MKRGRAWRLATRPISARRIKPLLQRVPNSSTLVSVFAYYRWHAWLRDERRVETRMRRAACLYALGFQTAGEFPPPAGSAGVDQRHPVLPLAARRAVAGVALSRCDDGVAATTTSTGTRWWRFGFPACSCVCQNAVGAAGRMRMDCVLSNAATLAGRQIFRV